jgi:hypothetical protein
LIYAAAGVEVDQAPIQSTEWGRGSGDGARFEMEHLLRAGRRR